MSTIAVPTLLNLIDSDYSKAPSLRAKYGLLILNRVRFHVTFDEPYDDGWGDAVENLTNLWSDFVVTDKRNAA